jgi:hypothetical protein
LSPRCLLPRVPICSAPYRRLRSNTLQPAAHTLRRGLFFAPSPFKNHCRVGWASAHPWPPPISAAFVSEGMCDPINHPCPRRSSTPLPAIYNRSCMTPLQPSRLAPPLHARGRSGKVVALDNVVPPKMTRTLQAFSSRKSLAWPSAKPPAQTALFPNRAALNPARTPNAQPKPRLRGNRIHVFCGAA